MPDAVSAIDLVEAVAIEILAQLVDADGDLMDARHDLDISQAEIGQHVARRLEMLRAWPPLVGVVGQKMPAPDTAMPGLRLVHHPDQRAVGFAGEFEEIDEVVDGADRLVEPQAV